MPDFSGISVQLDHIILVGLIAFSLAYAVYLRDKVKIVTKLNELQDPANMRLLEDQFSKQSEQTKALINLVGNLVLLLHQSVPAVERIIDVPDDLEVIIKEVSDTLTEIRDEIPVDSKD